MNALCVIEKYIDITLKTTLTKMMVLKTLIGMSKKCVDDGSLEVREKALMILAKI